jgi:hypothetical protein
MWQSRFASSLRAALVKHRGCVASSPSVQDQAGGGNRNRSDTVKQDIHQGFPFPSPSPSSLSADSDTILIHRSTSHPAFALYRRQSFFITLMAWLVPGTERRGKRRLSLSSRRSQSVHKEVHEKDG